MEKKPYGKSVDWWSFGIFIYELNSGTVPFRHNDHNEHLFTKILRARFNTPNEFSPTLSDICRRLIVKEPRNRLGCSKHESNEVRNHSWFYSIDWLAIYNQLIPSPSTCLTHEPSSRLKRGTNKTDETPIKIARKNRFSREFADF